MKNLEISLPFPLSVWKHRSADFIELLTIYMSGPSFIANEGNGCDLFGDAIVQGTEEESPLETLVGVDCSSKQD